MKQAYIQTNSINGTDYTKVNIVKETKSIIVTENIVKVEIFTKNHDYSYVKSVQTTFTKRNDGSWAEKDKEIWRSKSLNFDMKTVKSN